MSTEAWRVLPLDVGPPGPLIAAAAALLDGLTDDPVPTLRWYRATTTAIVLGRGQAAPHAAAIVPRRGQAGLPGTANGLEVHARSTGGGAVLLTPDMLSLDVALPAGHPLLAGTLSSVFLPIGLRVNEGPAVATRRGTERERLLAAVCYATRGRGEVLAGGRKLVGLAQRRRRQGALVQCGLLRRWRPEPLLSALGADSNDAEIARAAVGLDELVDPPPDDEHLVEVVSKHLTG